MVLGLSLREPAKVGGPSSHAGETAHSGPFGGHFAAQSIYEKLAWRLVEGSVC